MQLMGSELAWYEKASDSFPRGSIMLNPQVLAKDCEKEVGGEKYVFEVIDSSRHDSKRRREFACETMTDRKFWVQALNKSIESQMNTGRTRSVSRNNNNCPGGEDGEDEGGEGDRGESQASESSGFFSSIMSNLSGGAAAADDEGGGMYFPETKLGLLDKHNTWGNFQARYVECTSGELRYYKNLEAFEEKKKEPARIYLGDCLKGSPCLNPEDQRGFYLATDSKVYKFRAASTDEALSWIANIEEWKTFLNSGGG